jgi:hypothetical protein
MPQGGNFFEQLFDPAIFVGAAVVVVIDPRVVLHVPARVSELKGA